MVSNKLSDLSSVDVIDVWLAPERGIRVLSITPGGRPISGVRPRAKAADTAHLNPESGKTIFELKQRCLFRIQRDGARVASQSHHTIVYLLSTRTGRVKGVSTNCCRTKRSMTDGRGFVTPDVTAIHELVCRSRLFSDTRGIILGNRLRRPM
jgi:hypothetical protein